MSPATGFTVRCLWTAGGQSGRDFDMLAPEWQKLIKEKLQKQVLSQKVLAFRKVRN